MTASADNSTWLANPVEASACTVIAEIAQAHDGSLGLAHAHIDAAADAGADAVKFQTHIAEAESTPSEPWRVRFRYSEYGAQDDARMDYWRRMEFTAEQWAGLRQHAHDRGLLFLSSPFSNEAFDLLERIGVAGWKIASGEITNMPMLERMAASGLPVLLSTGMSGWGEIDAAAGLFRQAKSPLAVFQCTTAYPSPPESIGLNVLAEIRARYGCAAGLSDHSGTIYPSIAAATLGVDVIEVHLAMSTQMFGPDVTASVVPEQLKALVEGVRFVERMKAHPADKANPDPALEANRAIFLKSLVATSDLDAGEILTSQNMAARKPGTGISASRMAEIEGRRLARAVKRNVPITEQDLES